MYAVGVIEVVAGLVVAIRPKYGSLLVAGWLAGIIVNLLLILGYYDIALRDFGLLLAALALFRLAGVFEEGYDELVLARGIPVHSLCEHHLLPFTGIARVG